MRRESLWVRVALSLVGCGGSDLPNIEQPTTRSPPGQQGHAGEVPDAGVPFDEVPDAGVPSGEVPDAGVPSTESGWLR